MRFLPSVIQAAEKYVSQTGALVEVVIVDDGSTDDTAAWLLEQGFSEKRSVPDGQCSDSRYEAERARNGETASEEDAREVPGIARHFIKNGKNVGFGEACNSGFATATHRLVFLLNNDVEVDSDSIAPLVECFDDDSVFSVHCRMYELESGRECGTGKMGGFARGFIRVHQSYLAKNENANREVEGNTKPLYSMFAGGGSVMLDREKFLAIGGFDPLLSLFYWEDVELSYRAWKRGFSILYEPRAMVRHQVSSTIGKLNRRQVRMIEQRNRLIYHWVNLHDWKMLSSHILWVVLRTLTAPLRFQPTFVLSVLAALKRLPQILNRRREERRAAKRTDRNVLEIFDSLQQRDDVIVYDDQG